MMVKYYGGIKWQSEIVEIAPLCSPTTSRTNTKNGYTSLLQSEQRVSVVGNVLNKIIASIQ